MVERAKRRLLGGGVTRQAGRLARPIRVRDRQRRTATARPGFVAPLDGRDDPLRKQCPEIGWGDWRIVPTGSRNVLAIAYKWRGTTIVCVHNFAHAPREATLKLGGGTLTNLVDVEEVGAARTAFIA